MYFHALTRMRHQQDLLTYLFKHPSEPAAYVNAYLLKQSRGHAHTQDLGHWH